MKPKENELFIYDRRLRDSEDYDGSGKSNSYFNEKEYRSRKFRAVRVYLIFMFFSVLLIGITTYQLLLDLNIKSSSYKVECTYTQDSYMAWAKDENGTLVMLTFDELSERSGGTIIMYYSDDIKNAKPVTSMWFYVIIYIVWGAILVGFAYLLWRACHSSHHSVQREGKSRFDD